MRNQLPIAVFLALATSGAVADCGWNFHIKNNTGRTISISSVGTRTLGPSFKTQWWWIFTGSYDIEPGQKRELPPMYTTSKPFSFRSDANCNKKKNIDFKTSFRCDDVEGAFWKKALNRQRDGGDYTMYIALCSNVTN